MLHVLYLIYLSDIYPLWITFSHVTECHKMLACNFGAPLFIAICFRKTFPYMLFIVLVHMSLLHIVWVLRLIDHMLWAKLVLVGYMNRIPFVTCHMHHKPFLYILHAS